MGMAQKIQTGGDVIAVATAGGALIELVPPTAAAFSIVWLTMQIIIHFPEFKKAVKKYFKKKE